MSRFFRTPCPRRPLAAVVPAAREMRGDHGRKAELKEPTHG